MMEGNNTANHASKACFELLPIRNHTTDGPGLPRNTYSAKSSSLVIMTA